MLIRVKALLNRATARIRRHVIPLFSIVVGFLSPTLHCATLVPVYGTYFGGTGDTNTAVAVALDSRATLSLRASLRPKRCPEPRMHFSL